MKNKKLAQKYHDDCRIAQVQFNVLAEAHACILKDIANAEAEREMTSRLIADQINAAAEAARKLRKHGFEVPMLIEDHDFYREFAAGMSEGELHADLEEIARIQGFGNAANNEQAA